MITVHAEPDQLRKVMDAFRRGGGEGKPIMTQMVVSWGTTEEEALHEAHQQWAPNLIGGDVNWELRRPSDFNLAK